MPDLPSELRASLVHVKAPKQAEGPDGRAVEATVRQVLDAVRADGDAALRTYSATFDGMVPERFEVSEAERAEALAGLDRETRKDTEFAIERVRAFAEAQLATLLPLEVEALPGLHLGHRIIPIRRIGAYVPGGRYPLLSAPVM